MKPYWYAVPAKEDPDRILIVVEIQSGRRTIRVRTWVRHSTHQGDIRREIADLSFQILWQKQCFQQGARQ